MGALRTWQHRLDPSTRTLQARIETNNPGEKLKKDMYVVATVSAGTIPNAIGLRMLLSCAILRTQRLFIAAASANQFGRPVSKHSAELNGQTQITSGQNQATGSRKWQLVPAVCELAAAAKPHRASF